LFQRSRVLGRYDAEYVRCGQCGFVQTIDPVWLAEAYDEAVVSTDIGSVFRCDELSKIAKTLLHAFFDPRARCVDYGGGYGLFVRRMRDLGYDFRWYDKYCRNLFANGFAADLATGERFELLTAFEVFEHLPDPWTDIRRMAALSENVFFTTELLPTPAPAIADWWYYLPQHGQHIAFYTRRSLEVIAEKLDAHLCSAGALHLITRYPRSERLFAFLTRRHVAETFDFLKRRPSLLFADFEAAKAALSAPVSSVPNARADEPGPSTRPSPQRVRS
jgi:hypothetical protein